MRRWTTKDERLINSVELDWDSIINDEDPFRMLYVIHMVYPYSILKINNENLGIKHIEEILNKISI